MEKNVKIKELKDGEQYEGYAGIASKQMRTKRDGDPFMFITLSDSSGSISGNHWEATQELYDILAEGMAVKVAGKVGSYNGTLQITIQSIRPVDKDDDFNVALLMAEPPDHIKLPDLKRTYDNILSHSLNDIDREIIKKVMSGKSVFRMYINAPAARNIHHTYMHGLFVHSLSVANMAFEIRTKSYTHPTVDLSLLVTAALLHDIGKIYEYSWGAATTYTTEGKLAGHSVIGARMVRNACVACNVPEERIMLLEHCLLSHHGTLEHDACVLPQTPEAHILHHADMIDSRLEVMRMAEVDGGWSDPVFALGRTQLYFAERDN